MSTTVTTRKPKNPAVADAIKAAAAADARAKALRQTPDDVTAVSAARLEDQLKGDANDAEMAANPVTPVATAMTALTHTLSFDKEGKILPESFQETLKVMSPAFAEVQLEQVDRTFFSTFTDMFRVASLLSTEYGVLPNETEMGKAWQAAQAPEMFAFDKSVLSPTQAGETQGVLQPMTWQEIKARQDTGLKPLSGAQWTFFIETCERVLHGISYLHTMRALGYQSQHTRKDIWKTAMESETKRQNNYKLQQEAEHYRKAEQSKGALEEATKTGGALDL